MVNILMLLLLANVIAFIVFLIAAIRPFGIGNFLMLNSRRNALIGVPLSLLAAFIITCLIGAASPKVPQPLPVASVSPQADISDNHPKPTAAPFGQPVQVSPKMKLTVTTVEMRNLIGAGVHQSSAPAASVFVAIEYLIETPGIKAVALEPEPDMFLRDANVQVYRPSSHAENYAYDPGFSDRFDAALLKNEQMLGAQVFEVPLGAFDRATWHLVLADGTEMALK